MCTFKKTALSVIVAVLVTGCGSSTKSPSLPAENNNPSPSTSNQQPFTTEKLELDFSLSLQDIGLNLAKMTGITFNYQQGYFVTITEIGELTLVEPNGSLVNNYQLNDSEQQWSDITFVGDNEYLLSSVDGVIYRLEMQGLSLVEEADLSSEIDELHNIGFNPTLQQTVLVSDAPLKRMFNLSGDQLVSSAELDARFGLYSITGMQIGEQGTYLSAVLNDQQSNQQASVIKLDENNSFIKSWDLGETLISGLVAVDEDAPEFITTHSDSTSTIKLYAPPPAPSIPSTTSLQSVTELELEFDQPSGVHFNQENNSLYYVTDFGEVRRGTVDGSSELLFEIDDQQGSVEAITVTTEDDGEILIFVLKSDNGSEKTSIEAFSEDGELEYSLLVETENSEHVFESIDYDQGSETFVTINANQEMQKQVYFVNQNQTTSLVLPQDYDELIISGLTLTDNEDVIYFVTEEYEDDGTKYAGLLIEFDLEQNQEINRRSITTVNDDSTGLTVPSGVTVDNVNDRIYITTDIDDSVLNVYQTP